MRSFPAIEDPRLSSRAQSRDPLFALGGRTFTSGTQRSPGITGYAVLDDSTCTVMALSASAFLKTAMNCTARRKCGAEVPSFQCATVGDLPAVSSIKLGSSRGTYATT